MFSEETSNGVQLSDITSHDPAVSNIKTSTMKKQKVSKKKSSGFENPVYYSPKVRLRNDESAYLHSFPQFSFS